MTAAAPAVTIDAAMADPNLLGAALGDPGSWTMWRTVLKAAFGLDLSSDEAQAFAGIAGNRSAPTHRVRELWAIIGRRSGKSRVAAMIGVYIAALTHHRDRLSRGEIGYVLILAGSKAQANTVFAYCRAFIEASPLLRQLAEDVTADEIRLKGNIALAVHTNNYKTVRGRTLLAAVFDEVGFWRDETTSLPDVETYRAVLPALATTQGMLIGISTPYAQRGLLYTKHRAAFGQDDADVLVVQAATDQFNPTLDHAIIQKLQDEDPEAAQAEWCARFRADLATFVDRAVVEACVEQGVRERPPQLRFRYCAFCDPSGGTSDSMTLAIGHYEEQEAILDAIREIKAPFNPADAVNELVKLLAAYRCRTVRGDRYAGQWVSAEFKKYEVTYAPTDRNKSEIYLDALPLMNAGTARILDNPRLVSQIAQLERRVTRVGRDVVDHQRGAHDDVANAALGVLVTAYAARNSASADFFSRANLPKVVMSHPGMRRPARMRPQHAPLNYDPHGAPPWRP